jgi:uncharacterized protein YecE (DUF72 family)
VVVAVGTSGWQYRDWRDAFYPHRLPARRWLAYYATQFPTVELNSTFYRLPERETFEHWREGAPDGFVFAAKASRYLTHIRRLRDPEQPVARMLERASALHAKLGPVLVQLPPTMPADLERLAATLRSFPRAQRVAVEVRHPSWAEAGDELFAVLADHDAALCLADRRGVLPPVVRTASWWYLRFHEGRATPSPSYGRAALTSWVERVGERFSADDDGYVYFNNDTGGAAPRDARRFERLLRRAGFEVMDAPAPVDSEWPSRPGADAA